MVTKEELFNLRNLNDAFYQCFEANKKKHSNQVYYNGLLFNNLDLMDEILSGTYKVSKTTNFQINERGKVRDIKSSVMRDRIVQKIICQHVLVPQLVPRFIYDNYSSIQGRGTTMARKRFENMLYKFLREIDYDYKNQGYILEIDIHKFFNNIDHEILKGMLVKDLDVSPDLLDLIFYLIDSSSDTEKGLDIGSELPQILAMYYLSKMDNYLKCHCGIKFYGRYADDMFIIARTKSELQKILKIVKWQLSLLKLKVNEKKTQIVKLKHGFTYLQTKYKITKTKGKYKLLKSPTRPKITRERHRLKGHARQVELNNLKYEDIHNWYKAYRRSLITDYNAVHRTIESLDKLYKELFSRYENQRKPKKLTRTMVLLGVERRTKWKKKKHRGQYTKQKSAA